MGSPMEQEEAGNGTIPNLIPNIPQCSYYRQGLCTRGNSCPFSHSILAKPMPCKFYQSFSVCCLTCSSNAPTMLPVHFNCLLVVNFYFFFFGIERTADHVFLVIRCIDKLILTSICRDVDMAMNAGFHMMP
jgi:hypothetical protein